MESKQIQITIEESKDKNNQLKKQGLSSEKRLFLKKDLIL